MARRIKGLYDKDGRDIWFCAQTQSSWYNGTRKWSYTPVGILIHDTGK